MVSFTSLLRRAVNVAIFQHLVRCAFPPFVASFPKYTNLGVGFGLSREFVALHLAVSLEFKEDRVW